jgi:hypothetical protein
MGRARVASSRFSLCSACPERSLWGGDGLETLDTVSGRPGQKEASGDVDENVFLSDAPQIPLGEALRNAAGDGLRLCCSRR